MSNKNTLDTKVERIRQEYKNGVPAKKLAKQHGVSDTSIYKVANGSTYKGRGGPVSRHYEPVTTLERAEMQQLYASGKSLSDIASQMGRKYNTVYYWCVVRAESGDE